MRTLRSIGLTAALAISLGACSTISPKVEMDDDTKVRVEPRKPEQVAMITQSNNGSLYSPSTYRPLFEDDRARFVGDILTIEIAEQIDSTMSRSKNLSRSDSMSYDLPLSSILDPFFRNSTKTPPPDLNASASSSKDFSGSGNTSANNEIFGTLTVTVREVLPNGYLKVIGEKQIGGTNEVEYLRFSGVVNPNNIQAGNTVSSTKVADARIEYRGKGGVDTATTMAWLSRFFFSVLPF